MIAHTMDDTYLKSKFRSDKWMLEYSCQNKLVAIYFETKVSFYVKTSKWISKKGSLL